MKLEPSYSSWAPLRLPYVVFIIQSRGGLALRLVGIFHRRQTRSTAAKTVGLTSTAPSSLRPDVTRLITPFITVFTWLYFPSLWEKKSSRNLSEYWGTGTVNKRVWSSFDKVGRPSRVFLPFRRQVRALGKKRLRSSYQRPMPKSPADCCNSLLFCCPFPLA